MDGWRHVRMTENRNVVEDYWTITDIHRLAHAPPPSYSRMMAKVVPLLPQPCGLNLTIPRMKEAVICKTVRFPKERPGECTDEFVVECSMDVVQKFTKLVTKEQHDRVAVEFEANVG
ncbi:hypothetical protein PAXRUDRAFT_557054 [Paxillus rubicundulus Ve08.2h10]|uniref:Uncharacterized protein n=1 Tax=Paxillus rubicundulus Ve08.2h10 TaxID=930991 RepID=A0A0D0D736_9AGAM|nr:hypothetical protein PAXRUDRAFT_557054 [Paxillus rubicundulus Ve08.2h10]